MRDFTFNGDNKFDIQLSAAQRHERDLAALFTNEALTIEVKTESWIWRHTGNIAVEFANHGKPSGISVTQADLWVHELCDDRGRPVVRLVFEVERLKELCRTAFRQRSVMRNCGDHKRSDFILLSVGEIMRAAKCPS